MYFQIDIYCNGQYRCSTKSFSNLREAEHRFIVKWAREHAGVLPVIKAQYR